MNVVLVMLTLQTLIIVAMMMGVLKLNDRIDRLQEKR